MIVLQLILQDVQQGDLPDAGVRLRFYQDAFVAFKVDCLGNDNHLTFEINVPVHRVRITMEDGVPQYESVELEKRQFPSLWMPIPAGEMRRAPLLLQNEGWEAWK